MGASRRRRRVAKPPARVPRTPREITALESTRPPGWELLLFAAVLLEGKRDLEARWRDHRLRLPTGEHHRLREEDVAPYLADAISRLRWAVRPMEPVFAAHEEAFGRPGEPGDPELIRHFAVWIVEVQRRLLDWADAVRSADAPPRFDRALDLAARAADRPLERIRAFIDDTVAALDELPAKLAAPPGERERITLDLTLTLDADSELMAAAVDELRRALTDDEP
jgi:hypothetical protein